MVNERFEKIKSYINKYIITINSKCREIHRGKWAHGILSAGIKPQTIFNQYLRNLKVSGSIKEC